MYGVQHGDSLGPFTTADIYGEPPHIGCGGWTGYTGSAGWLYRLLVETLLGLHKQGEHLHFRPHMPKTWDSYKLHYRYLQTVYHLTFLRDPNAPPPEPLHLVNDRQEHQVEIKVAEASRL